MATTNEEIGARVKVLLERHGVGRPEICDLLGIDASGLSRALSGERMFKAREIALMAERLGVSTAAILEDESDKQSAVAIAARKSQHDEGATRRAIDRAEFFVELADLAESTSRPNFDWLDVPADGPAWKQGQDLAVQILDRFDLGSQPLPGPMHELAAVLESSLGVQVALEALGSGLDGLSVCCDAFKLAIVSTSTAPVRQRWTLAHEIGHLVLDDTQDVLVDESVWGRDPIETRANAFAAGLLMPAELLRAEWGSAVTPNEDLIGHLLETFHVSLDALAFRLHNVGLINAAGRDRVRAMRPLMSLVRNQAPQGEGMWLPTVLTGDTISAYAEGRIGARWLAALLSLDPDEMLERLQASSEEADAFDAVDQELLAV